MTCHYKRKAPFTATHGPRIDFGAVCNNSMATLKQTPSEATTRKSKAQKHTSTMSMSRKRQTDTARFNATDIDSRPHVHKLTYSNTKHTCVEP